MGVKPWQPGGEQRRRGIDWILDRAVETAPLADGRARADDAWNRLRDGLAERSGFVRRHLRAAGADLASVERVADLPRLPLCSKADLRDSQDRHPPFGDHLGVDEAEVKLVYQTSGTTGRPCRIALTRGDAEMWWTIGARSYRATGMYPHDSVLVSLGAGPFVAGHTHGSVDRTGARRVPVAPGDTARVLDAAAAGLFDTIVATPSFALHLADRCAREGIDAPRLGIRHIVSGGEPGGGIPSTRARIEASFDCDVTEAMGLGDIAPSLYGECEAKEGMHFCGQGFVWPELIDSATSEPLAIETGVVGEVVYTTLQREAMPLVRFRSGDIVEIMGTSCECGRTSFRARCLARSDDMFIVRGVNVYPSAIVAVVGEFQPHVSGRARVVLPVGAVAVDPPVAVQVELAAADAPADLAARIADAIRQRLTFRASVELVAPDEFGDAGYKTNLVARR
ncbi:MAG: phenylacetate--CoA ligase family protein [Acidimicrobiales bacterium]